MTKISPSGNDQTYNLDSCPEKFNLILSYLDDEGIHISDNSIHRYATYDSDILLAIQCDAKFPSLLDISKKNIFCKINFESDFSSSSPLNKLRIDNCFILYETLLKLSNLSGANFSFFSANLSLNIKKNKSNNFDILNEILTVNLIDPYLKSEINFSCSIYKNTVDNFLIECNNIKVNNSLKSLYSDLSFKHIKETKEIVDILSL